ncbi:MULTISPECIES: LysM peptidoglycan-binding domain-containing protein [Streptococcus]|uniref:LysM peptidoglycan-binding domain-containing protein n=1 Tax=Streptococcus pseudopneumoniae TaxID=257758 RepID=A0AAW4C832_9STRE|nr:MULTISPECIES: LysM domain-containing protein [Streptococcus]MBF9646022.1 LysM peptidoglycan-binding domain-containing protein [Streptococcus pseudopneumoniae]MBF9674036.1 LysM peptidoglycan-binding domain-containing protein [Streptococcus pseudopneumoniae]MBW8145877.1 LysM peptidoglycan-binding domain-containing protein [Streptococcus pseudopneumoniae]TMR52691.1 LysM peptidoglycan-binding domain-containing protein [Streptococcus pseudopneumoniae]TMR58466.1 LysM peptidoglycan-binding domain-
MKSITKKIKATLAGVAALFAVFAPSFVSAQESSTYTVKEGDTLSEIAETHNTTVEKLAENNHIDNIHLIYVGQELVIDGPVAPAAPASTTYEAPAAQDEAVSAPVAETTEVEEETPVVSETVAEETVASTVSGSEAEAKEWIAQKESGGSYTATNGRYIGRYQLTDSYLNGDYSAENQERVADAYVAGRYGSWTAAKNFWLNNGWY